MTENPGWPVVAVYEPRPGSLNVFGPFNTPDELDTWEKAHGKWVLGELQTPWQIVPITPPDRAPRSL